MASTYSQKLQAQIQESYEEAKSLSNVFSSIDIENGVFRIVLNRPQRSNSLTFGMELLLLNKMREAVEDVQTRVIIFSASGRNFSGGADLLTALKTLPANQEERKIL